MTEQRYCGAGDHYVEASQFHKRGKGYQPNCKSCQNALNRERYKKYKNTHIAQVKSNNARRNSKFLAWKSHLCCCICGEQHTSCLDFHHLDPTTKDFVISGAGSKVGMMRLIEEIQKCVVVCKNCHTKIHDGVIDATTLLPIDREVLELLHKEDRKH